MRAFGWNGSLLGVGLAGLIAVGAVGASPAWAVVDSGGASHRAVVYVKAGSHTALSSAAEVIIGTNRADVITDVGDGDVVISKAGDDRIFFKSGESDEPGVVNATVDTGTGNDVVVFYHRNSSNTITTGPGNDRALAMGSRNLQNTFEMGPGNDFVDQGDETSGNRFVGGTGNDEVIGNNGEGGSLYFDLGAGDDSASTGRLSGQIIGGPGDDSIVLGSTSSHSIVNAGTGKDYVEIEGDGGNHTIDTGSGNDRVELLGNTSSNTIRLGPGADVLTTPGSELVSGTMVDGGTNFDSAEFDAPAVPANVCVRVEHAVNC
jgi:Ca2+-binding RTX toxin-like protein